MNIALAFVGISCFLCVLFGIISLYMGGVSCECDVDCDEEYTVTTTETTYHYED